MKKASAKKQTKKPQQKTGGKGKQPVVKAPVKPPRHGPQALIHEREYEPKHISKEDVEFFSENSGYLSFLQSVDVDKFNEPSKKKKKKKDEEDEDIESQYEQTRLNEVIEEQQEAERKEKKTRADEILEKNPNADIRKVKFSLPVKNQNGVLVPQVQHIDNTEAKVPTMSAAEKKKKRKREKKPVEEEEQVEPVVSDDEEDDEPATKRTKVDPEKEEAKEERASLQKILKDPIMRARRINKMKEQIAVLCTETLTEPVGKINNLNTLYELCLDGDDLVRKMAILSLAALFKDLIPDYRINIDLLSDNSVMLSKEVKELRYFELNLIKSYQKYVEYLERHSKKSGSDLQYICAKSMGELLSHAPHFNLENVLIKGLVPLLNNKDEKVGDIVSDNICKLFEKDLTHGEASLDVVEAIAKFIVKKNYDVHERMINVFLALPLKTIIADKILPVQFSSKHKSKKKDKRKKGDMTDDDKLDKELKEGEAKQSQSQSKIIQTDLLRNVIVCYVRLLKMDAGSPLLFASMAGLAQFAHLMNVDLLYDLLDYLKGILNDGDEDEKSKANLGDADEIGGKFSKLPVATILQSLVTTAKLMTGIGAAIDIDLKEFYNQLYQVIPRALLCSPTSTPDERNIRLLIDALFLLLVKPAKLPLVRVAAFLKRLSTFALESHTHVTIAFLEIIFELLVKYPNARQLLSGEESGLGVYEPNSINPDNSNPFATSMWEIYSLRGSYHERVRKLTVQINKMCSSLSKNQQATLAATHKSLKGADYHTIITDYSPLSGKFNPPVKQPEPVPAQAKYEKMLEAKKEMEKDKNSKSKNKKILRHVYITPSLYAMQESNFIASLRSNVMDQKSEELASLSELLN